MLPQGSVAKPPSAAPLRVMVVDDSAVLRGVISRLIAAEPQTATVVATAANGQLAVERAQARDLDVIILDIEMPVMDGITALPLLLKADPRIVVIMASTLTTRNADISLRALAAGAKDYVPKPSSLTVGSGADDFKRELLEKIRVLGGRFRRALGARPSMAAPGAGKDATIAVRPATLARPQALAICSSTGGPSALMQVLKGLRTPLSVPVFITQHMPPTFTGLLATNITRETGHRCAEARHGEVVEPGRIYLAPGDFHMTAAREGTSVKLSLNQEEKENFCRPAADPMLRALVGVYQRNLLAVVLTGMGQDGLKGCTGLVGVGGNVLAQDEASSVVWGMPGAVAKAGLCCAIVPLEKMSAEIAVHLGRA